MGKPLWKFLSDGGMSAAIEYGKVNSIRIPSNCCAWATGDLLYHDFCGDDCFVGQFNTYNSNIDKIDPSNGPTFEFMDKYFTRNMLNNGAQFLGMGEKIPTTDENHYIVAAFHFPNDIYHSRPDFHFVRQHNDGKWSHRQGYSERISDYFENTDIVPKTIFDFNNTTHYIKSGAFNQPVGRPKYKIFKGWYAIPNNGMQNDMYATIANVRTFITKSNWGKLPESLQRCIKSMCQFNLRRNNILQDITTLDNLGHRFSEIVSDFNTLESENRLYLDKILEKYNQNRFADITHSPARDLRVK